MDRIAWLGGEVPFSEDDMRKLCEGRVHVVSYKEAVELGSIHSVLGKHGAAIVLCETSPNYGHWIALMHVANSPRTIEWFDPYGDIGPDEEWKSVPRGFRAQSGQDGPRLMEMIQEGGYERVLFNEAKLQTKRGQVSTCGRWCAMRVNLRQFSLKKFQAIFMNQKLAPDQYVTMLTLFVK